MRLGLSFILWFSYVCALCECTDIKWESAAEGGESDPAKTAPKSQRYWDEHNIERPDYAKTDAEIAAEAGHGLPWLPWMMAVLLVVFSLFVAHYQKHGRQSGTGQRLGSSDNSANPLLGVNLFSSPSTASATEDRTRQARLERFGGEHAKDE